MLANGPDPPFTENHLGVALRHDIFRRHEPLVQGGVHAPLEHYRLLGPAGAEQQAEVLHIPGPDLDDVGIFGHQFQGLLVHSLGDDEQPRLLPHLGENLQAGFLHSLITVRGGTGLISAAPEDASPGGFDA